MKGILAMHNEWLRIGRPVIVRKGYHVGYGRKEW